MRKITEQQKDNMPGTSQFIWWVPCFVFLAIMCRVEPERIVYQHNMEVLSVFGWKVL